MGKYVVAGACTGRHDIPEVAGNYIFDEVIEGDVFAYDYANKVVSKLEGVTKLDLYVTGLTLAVLEVVMYCQSHNIELTLWHYDFPTKSYKPQLFDTNKYL